MTFKRGIEREDISKVCFVAGKLMSRQIIRGEVEGPLQVEPNLFGQEEQEKGHEGDNEMEKIKMPFKSLLFRLC